MAFSLGRSSDLWSEFFTPGFWVRYSK